jgi:hypothetical protein
MATELRQRFANILHYNGVPKKQNRHTSTLFSHWQNITKSNLIMSGIELVDIFHRFGEAFHRQFSISPAQLKVMNLIKICRTAKLGGHMEKCDQCGFERPAYNSCRNRHCPKCQTIVKEQWLNNRREELLLHLHCLIPAGALSFDEKTWRQARKKFLFKLGFRLFGFELIFLCCPICEHRASYK